MIDRLTDWAINDAGMTLAIWLADGLLKWTSKRGSEGGCKQFGPGED